ncbi:hypothetical protein G6O69_31080 [Pseudenhygromyxa sp. WMMC2535]|uniref:hypothetical protein n=1 Tax=Pseudenhygromyxa sp. WMMC2535 TaxID=2712867 RepID=UPI001554BC8E|nr:hypothetical protein [Pseudenhygromyxa sp. WMMC2535]NVB42308.1 hypothetical protein [Pseudenhygromyxa sp. WMMC2535]
MRRSNSTAFTLALATTLASLACNAGEIPIGSLDDDTGTDAPETSSDDPETSSDDLDTGSDDLDTGSDDPDMGQVITCEQPGVSAEFEVIGLDPESYDVELSCEQSSVSDAEGGYVIDLSECGDDQQQLQIVLAGSDWIKPEVDLGGPVEIRYLELPLSIALGGVMYTARWLSVRNDPFSQFPLSFIAVDAPSLDPSEFGDFEVDYAPLLLDIEAIDCEPVEHVCAQLDRQAMVVTTQGESFTIADGQVGAWAGADSLNFRVIVEQARRFVDDCPDFPMPYRFGIVAYPNS